MNTREYSRLVHNSSYEIFKRICTKYSVSLISIGVITVNNFLTLWFSVHGLSNSAFK